MQVHTCSLHLMQPMRVRDDRVRFRHDSTNACPCCFLCSFNTFLCVVSYSSFLPFYLVFFPPPSPPPSPVSLPLFPALTNVLQEHDDVVAFFHNAEFPEEEEEEEEGST